MTAARIVLMGAVVSGVELDPDFASVVLLVPGDVDFSDKSNSNHTPTVGGNAVVSAAQQLFGLSTIKLDGSGDYWTYPNNTDFDFGANEWTIEYNQLWLVINTQTTFARGSPTSTDQTNRMILHRLEGGTRLQIFYSTNGSGYISIIRQAFIPVVATWYHVAWVRQGNVWRLYVDGIQISSATAAVTLFNSAGVWSIGQREGFESVNGHLANYRMSKVVRYPNGTTFTPPIVPHPTA